MSNESISVESKAVESEVVTNNEAVEVVTNNEAVEVVTVDGVDIPTHEAQAQELRSMFAPVLDEQAKQARFKELCNKLVQVELSAWQYKLGIISELRTLYPDDVLTKKLKEEGVVDKLREAQKLVRMTLLRESQVLPNFESYSKSQIETISSLEPEIVKDNLDKLTPDLTFKQMREAVSALNPKSVKKDSEEKTEKITDEIPKKEKQFDFSTLDNELVWINIGNPLIQKELMSMKHLDIKDCYGIKRHYKGQYAKKLILDSHMHLDDRNFQKILNKDNFGGSFIMNGQFLAKPSYDFRVVLIPKKIFEYLEVEDLEQARG